MDKHICGWGCFPPVATGPVIPGFHLTLKCVQGTTKWGAIKVDPGVGKGNSPQVKWGVSGWTALLEYLPACIPPLPPHHQEGPSACFFFTWRPPARIKLGFTPRGLPLLRLCVEGAVGGGMSQASRELLWVGVCCHYILHAPAGVGEGWGLCYLGLPVEPAEPHRGWVGGLSSRPPQPPAGPARLDPEGLWGSASVCSGCPNKHHSLGGFSKRHLFS